MIVNRLWLYLCVTLLVAVATITAHAQTVDELYQQGVAARYAGRNIEAIDFFDRVLALDPDHADALVQLGFSQLAQTDHVEARISFERALAVAPDYSDARYGLALIAFREGDLVGARNQVEPLIIAAPDNQDFAKLMDSIESAEAGLRKKIASKRSRPKPSMASKQHASALEQLMRDGRNRRLNGDFTASEALYRRALVISPNNHDVLVALGLVNGAQEEYEEAEYFFNSALDIAPGSTDARLGLARLAIWQGRIADGQKQINGILQDEPENGEAMLLDARIALLARDYAIAEQRYAKIVQNDPGNVEANVGLGDARRLMGDDEGSREAFRRALELSPGSADIEQRLAAPKLRRWRLDIGTEISDLTNGRGTWTDSGTALSWLWTPDTTLTARARLATRYGKTDLQLSGLVNHVFVPGFSAYALLAGTPDADFLARYTVGSGFSWRAADSLNGLGPLYVNLDARFADYENSKVWMVAPWIQIYAFSERLAFTARWIHAEDNLGAVADGFLVRTDLTISDRIRLFAGYADAPEVAEGSLEETRTVFGGFSYNLTGDLSINANLAHEKRRTFDRNMFGLGLSVKF